MGIEVLVVQHGEKVRSAGDPGLTDLGHRQASTVARWLAENRPDIDAIFTSPLRRAQETAAPITAALGLAARTDPRFRERMNWDNDSGISLAEFLTDWQRATHHRDYQPLIGDSSNDASARFIAALVNLERGETDVVVVVAHGGVTVDVLRTIAGDSSVSEANSDLISDGVPCCAITRLRVARGVVTVINYPSTDHLNEPTPHRPA